ncbi:MAG: Dihydroneopterin aldolase (EC [uncultured Campylobacterales bacterium]|uniref:Dihydroneopterin aldolase (EC) n=1 Tax=uncultured Campylobacterales bacterium TaxID=352960 RepID=A0A6S6SSD3_9BACT|nr:MAG: Dihydroneopterin aldolase (EC [uncultured Campylobacterales bacterium]
MQIRVDQEFDTIIGILDFERVQKQKITINTVINYHYKGDGIFLNYADIASDVKNNIETNKFELIEDALISTIELLCNNHTKIKNIQMKISKPNIIEDTVVSVSLFKER